MLTNGFVVCSPFFSSDQSSTAREYKLPRWEVPALRGNSLWLGSSDPESNKMQTEQELSANMQRFGAIKSIKVDPKRRYAMITFMQSKSQDAVLLLLCVCSHTVCDPEL